MGSISTTALGGVGNYTYVWTRSNETTDDLQNLAGGVYALMVSDENNCVVNSEEITISEPNELIVTATPNEPNSCSPDAKGAINVEVSGGQGAYTYLWEDGSTEKDRADLGAGTYSITVTDASGCQGFAQDVEIMLETVPMEVALVEKTNIACGGAQNGQITMQVINGTAPFQYNWSIGEVDFSSADRDTLKDLAGGTYSLTVTDANGCVDTSIVVTLIESESLSLSLTKSDVICKDDSTGSVLLDIVGGTGTYTYNWSNGSTLKDLENLSNGEYSVTVTDENGCTATRSTFINQPSELELSSIKADIGCNGETNGRIQLAADGGWQDYSYDWNTGAEGSLYQNLSAGLYVVTVTDRKGCALIDSFTIIEPTLIDAQFIATPTSCPDSDDGKIELELTGGTAPFTYSWSNNQSSEDQFNLAPDFYILTITDGSGCVKVLDPIQIESTNTPAFDVAELNVLSPKCGGNCDGQIELSISGEINNNYSFNWNQGATSKDISELCPGNYQVTVTDEKGCFKVSESFEIKDTDSAPLEVQEKTVKRTSDCNGSNDGSVNFVVSGGIAPYNFNWGDVILDEPTRDNLETR